ncbi:MAG: 50S ribosomal protein L15 [Methanomassiliicoccales archaeon]|nr:50S ribosomal protein L15 [Methanomassiliicoccales archaeon]
MPSRTKKFRGSRTHGRGKKAGRGAGLRGGRGNAGLHKHKVMYMLKYDPDHFGRHGFKRPQSIVAAKIAMNVGEIQENINKLIADGFAERKDGKVTVNLTKMGVDKLLGSGKIIEPIDVIVADCSELAREKIEAAGGSVIQP